MLDYRIEPLGDYWPAGMKRRSSWEQAGDQFKSRFSDTLDRLEYELGKIYAEQVIIRLAVDARNLTNSGRLKNTDQSLGYSGVILNFVRVTSYGANRREVPHEFANDHYRQWKANLHGIALTLEALRGINRWGCAQREQQYTGFAALPPGDGMPPPQELWTPQKAADLLARHSGFTAGAILSDPEVRSIAHKRAVQANHPDRAGGDHEEMLRITKAVAVLAETRP